MLSGHKTTTNKQTSKQNHIDPTEGGKHSTPRHKYVTMFFFFMEVAGFATWAVAPRLLAHLTGMRWYENRKVEDVGTNRACARANWNVDLHIHAACRRVALRGRAASNWRHFSGALTTTRAMCVCVVCSHVFVLCARVCARVYALCLRVRLCVQTRPAGR